jgi:hypothetical protein
MSDSDHEMDGRPLTDVEGKPPPPPPPQLSENSSEAEVVAYFRAKFPAGTTRIAIQNREDTLEKLEAINGMPFCLSVVSSHL